jgi:geranylgeranyl pyrophosphate synthase
MSLPTSSLLSQYTHDFIRTQISPILDWSDFEAAIAHWLNRQDDASPETAYYTDVFPALIYIAVGGDYPKSIPLTAFWLLNILAARVFDDIQDQQGECNPWNQGGLVQSLPTGLALLTAANICFSHLESDIDAFRAIQNAFGRAGALAAKAQRLTPTTDLSSNSLEQYFFHIIGATAEIFATGAWAGGRLKTVDETTLNALREFGYNIGMRIAILSDCFDLQPASLDKPSDLTSGSYRLPVLYAASLTEHPDHPELMELLTKGKLEGGRYDTAITLLENMEAISWSVQLATEFQNRAIAALNSLPEYTQEALANYV